MSTILKALRRLEEDSSIEASNSSAPSSSSAALPATDPHATDELRSRILAEELAAEASGIDVGDPSNTKKRVLIATAIAAAAIVTTLIVGLGLGFYPPTPDDQGDAAVAASRSPTPSPFVPSPSRARSTSTTSIPSPFTPTPTPASPSPVVPLPVVFSRGEKWRVSMGTRELRRGISRWFASIRKTTWCWCGARFPGLMAGL